MIHINKSNLQDVFSAILKEYSESIFPSRFHDDNALMFEEHYGSLYINRVSEKSPNGGFPIRRYELKDAEGKLLMRFLLGLASTLFSHSALNFRENLIAEETIRGVVTLKQRIFSKTTIPAMIIFLDKEDGRDTWFASVDSLGQLVAYAIEDESVEFRGYKAHYLSAENLLPEFYNGDQEIIEEAFIGSETKELQDVATVINGKSAKRDDYSDKGIPYLRARDIKNGKIVKPDVFIESGKTIQFSRQLIQEGDILLTKNFGQNKLALVTEEDCPAIASNALFIIRPFDVSEGYLYRYLTSKTGNEIFNKQLNHVKRGTVIATVSLSDLKRILVPIYDEETMKNLEDVDSLSYDDAVTTSKTLLKHMSSGIDIEQKVSEELRNAGWDSSLLIKEWMIEIDSKSKYRADFTYQLADGRKVIVEVKKDLSLVGVSWVKAMEKILNLSEDYIFIFTTGTYYEVHVSGTTQSLKLMHAPTLNEIDLWKKGVH